MSRIEDKGEKDPQEKRDAVSASGAGGVLFFNSQVPSLKNMILNQLATDRLPPQQIGYGLYEQWDKLYRNKHKRELHLLLERVAQGKQAEAEEIVRVERYLILSTSAVTDYSGRAFAEISALGICVMGVATQNRRKL